MQTTRANVLYLNKRCEFWFDGQNVAVPLGHCSVGQLPAYLDVVAADTVVVEFNTTNDPKDIASDVRKYSKRLAEISQKWKRSDFSPTIEGSRIMTCTLSRRDQ